ncbi:MAG: DNA repair exonuclease [Pseudomonadota bacterium]|nr:DNA repair exonuclease [Pseudomonadota bacterium]
MVLRFIHTSDWQLGKPFGRTPAEARVALQEARLDVIDALAKHARAHDALWILVAGDVFDSPEPGDRVFRQALARMKAADDVRWLLLPGNHDPARADGLWSRLISEAPRNVLTALEPSPIDLGDELWVLPAPLQFKRSAEDPTAWFEGAETPPGARRIGLAHGAIQEFGKEGEGTNLIAPDRAKRAGLDYLALGDWHGRKAINPHTHYSGTPEPDDFGRDVTGVALLVDLSSTGAAPSVQDLAVARHTWAETSWQVSSLNDLEACLPELARGVDHRHLVARVTLTGLVTLAERVAIRERLEDGLAHEIRWLDLRLGDLFARPSDNDLADIDAHGVLRVAAERLLSMSEDAGPAGRRAATALERLYIEHQRAQKQVAA